MEARLKHDVLSEAAAFDGAILVSEENDDMQVRGGELGVGWCRVCVCEQGGCRW